MPQFSYSGLQAGKKVNGAIVANDRIDAGKKLKNQKIIATSLNQLKDNDADADADPEIKTFLGMQISSDKLSSVDVMLFTKKLETMIKADLPIMEALKLARRQATKPGLIKVTKTIIEDLNQGKTFSSCLLYTSPSPRDKRQSRMPSSA